MIGRPRPISAEQALGYFLRESQGIVQLTEHEDFPPELAGDLLPHLGLKPGPVTMESYTEFVLGDFPALRDQRLRLARELSCDLEQITRAVYEVMVSTPKSISLQLLISGDKRMVQIAKRANAAAMEMFRDYCFVRVVGDDGLVHKMPVAGLAYVRWCHISSREREPNGLIGVDGGADPQLHFHNLVSRWVLPLGSSELTAIEGKDAQISYRATEAVSR